MAPMTIATVRKQLGIEFPRVTVPDDQAPDHLAAIQGASTALVQSLTGSKVTIAQIDYFLQQHLDLLPPPRKHDIQQFLLSKKAALLFAQGNEEEGLKHYDQALSVKETPSTWSLKGTALLQMERLDEAFDAFQKSYSLKEHFGPQKQGYLEDLIGGWSVAALLRGLAGILDQDVREAEQGVFEYIELLNKAKEDNLQHMVLNLAAEQSVPEDIKAALEELVVMVRLLAIENPFERWRAFTKEISKVWPQGVSAVDAIREQRD